MAEQMSEDEARRISPPYKSRHGVAVKPGTCCAPVSGSGYYGYQCSKPVKATYGSLGYCGIHDPAKVKARQEKRDAESKARIQALTRQWAEKDRRGKLALESVEVLKIIARGHNCPSALARDTLEKFSEPWDERPAIPPNEQDEAS